MKNIIILAAVTIAVAFSPAKVAAFIPANGQTNAIGNLILSVSGTVKTQNFPENTNKMTVSTMSLNEKYVYQLISYAVPNVQSTIGTNYFYTTNLPTDGYIAFSPNYTLNNVPNYGTIYGLFYVTNKSGFYYPLSGFDTNGQFYSFIELDSFLTYATGNSITNTFVFDFGYFTSDLGSYGVSAKTGNGSGTSTSTGLLFIHDNPYSYDDLDNPDNFTVTTMNNYYGQEFTNYNVIEIRGIVTGKTTLKNFTASGVSFSLTGSGNFVEGGNTFAGVLTGGSAKLSR